MNIERIPLDRIDVGDRLRSIDEDYAQLIAANMAVHGQMTPIEVRELKKGRYALVAGGHRMRALQIAAIPDALCTLFDGTELQAKLREVDENLIRRELSELDRGGFLARRKELYEELHPATRHGGKRESGQVAMHGDLPARFTADAAEKVRLSERSIQRSIKIYTQLSAEVRDLVAGSWIASNGTQLEALSRLHHDAQRGVARALPRLSELRTVRELVAAISGAQSMPGVSGDPLDRQFDAFLRLWRRMPTAVRTRVREFLEEEKG